MGKRVIVAIYTICHPQCEDHENRRWGTFVSAANAGAPGRERLS